MFPKVYSVYMYIVHQYMCVRAQTGKLCYFVKHRFNGALSMSMPQFVSRRREICYAYCPRGKRSCWQLTRDEWSSEKFGFQTTIVAFTFEIYGPSKRVRNFRAERFLRNFHSYRKRFKYKQTNRFQIIFFDHPYSTRQQSVYKSVTQIKQNGRSNIKRVQQFFSIQTVNNKTI